MWWATTPRKSTQNKASTLHASSHCRHTKYAPLPASPLVPAAANHLTLAVGCVLLLFLCQRKGYGRFLIQFSYALSQKEYKVHCGGGGLDGGVLLCANSEPAWPLHRSGHPRSHSQTWVCSAIAATGLGVHQCVQPYVAAIAPHTLALVLLCVCVWPAPVLLNILHDYKGKEISIMDMTKVPTQDAAQLTPPTHSTQLTCPCLLLVCTDHVHHQR